MNEDVLKLKNQLCFRLYAVSRNMTRLYQPLLDGFNLTYPQYIILLVLFEHPVIDFKDLSTMVDLKTGTLTPIVQKLEERGLIRKERNPEDRRRLDVSLTKAGMELKESLVSVPINLAKMIAIDKELYYSLTKDLDTLLEALQEGLKTNSEVGYE